VSRSTKRVCRCWLPWISTGLIWWIFPIQVRRINDVFENCTPARRYAGFVCGQLSGRAESGRLGSCVAGHHAWFPAGAGRPAMSEAGRAWFAQPLPARLGLSQAAHSSTITGPASVAGRQAGSEKLSTA
jgi:hypothetical protein